MVVAIAASLALFTWPAMAQEQSVPQTEQAEGPGDQASGANAEVLTSDSGSNLISVAVRTDNLARSTSSTAFVDLPGATTSFVLGANTSDLFVSELSMETTNCSGTGFNFCEIRSVVIQAGATLLANPIDPITFTSESTNDESHSHQWSRRVSNTTSAGQVITVKAQWRCTPGPCTFSEDDFAFSVNRYN